MDVLPLPFMVFTLESDQRDIRRHLAGRGSLAVRQNKVHGWGETIQVSAHREVYCKEFVCMHVLSPGAIRCCCMAKGVYHKLD